MRPNPHLLRVAGTALVLAALSPATLSSSAQAFSPVPSSAYDEDRLADQGVVRVQSRQQRDDIDRFLDRNDFSNPDYVRRTPPRFFVEACRKQTKYLLMFTRDGEYFGSRKVGDCERRRRVVPLADLRRWLEDRRYTDIRFTKRTEPGRTAEACLNERHYSITFDEKGEGSASRKWFSKACRARDTDDSRRDDDRRDDGFGDDLDRDDDRAGTPGAVLSKALARRALSREGYENIRFDRYYAESGLVEVCQGVRKFRMRMDDRMGASARRAVGFCQQNVKNANFRPRRPDLKSLENRQDPLAPVECQAVLNWLQFLTPITFESASDELSRESRSNLQTIADNVGRCPGTTLRIEGHTDSVGPTRFNQKLSAQRAEVVRRFLVRRGVPSRRVDAKGFGEKYPLTDNLVARDRERNRRIDLVLEWGRAEDLGIQQSRRSNDDDR